MVNAIPLSAAPLKIYINAVLAHCTLFFSIIFTINIGIATYFVYYKDMNCNKENASIYDYVYQATNY